MKKHCNTEENIDLEILMDGSELPNMKVCFLESLLSVYSSVCMCKHMSVLVYVCMHA
jgi:hypothetical protein